jgi:uncharacterized membrane protein YidH (DUF202 family)
VQTTYADGTHEFCFANGQMERHNPDGSKAVNHVCLFVLVVVVVVVLELFIMLCFIMRL